MASKVVRAVAARGVVLTLAAFAPAWAWGADVSWSFRGGSVQLQELHVDPNDANALQTTVVKGLTLSASTIPNGVKAVGSAADSDGGTTNAFVLTGAEYLPGATGMERGMRVIGISDGFPTGPLTSAFDRIVSTFNFTVKLSGGQVNIFNAQTDYGLLGVNDTLFIAGVGSSGYSQVFDPGTTTADFQYVDAFNGPDVGLGDHIVGDFVINFEWTGFSATDTLEFNIPSSGFVIQSTVIPEAGTLGLLVPAMLVMGSRRR